MNKFMLSLAALTLLAGNLANADFTVKVTNNTGSALEKVRLKFVVTDQAGSQTVGSYHIVKNTHLEAGQTVTATINSETDLTIWQRADVNVAGKEVVKQLSASKVLVNLDGKTVCLKGDKQSRVNPITGTVAKVTFAKCKADSTAKCTQGCKKSYNGRCKNNHDCANLKIERGQTGQEIVDGSTISFEVVADANGALSVKPTF